MNITKSYLNELTYEVLGSAIEVHKALGPGLLESVYHKCLMLEFHNRKIKFETEFRIPFYYHENLVDLNLKCDLVVEGIMVLELKSVDQIHPIHIAQLFTYLKLLKMPKGILINFNVLNIFKEGQKTFVNELYQNLPD